MTKLYRILAILIAAALAAPVAAAPEKPTRDDDVLERLPKSSEIEDAHRDLQNDPNNLGLALQTARTYIASGRREADPRAYGYARAALAPWWRQETPPREVRVLRATIHQADHDFDAALADLNAVLATNPGHAQARLAKAMVLRAVGRPNEARENCVALSPRVPPLARTICLSATGSLLGDQEGSYHRLASALEAPGQNDGLRQWGLTVLGEIAVHARDLPAAERHFRDALSLDPQSVYALGALADLLLDLGRADEVRSILSDNRRPDALLLRLTEAELRLGSDTTALRDELAARFETNRRRGDLGHAREEARFYLRVLQQSDPALGLAKQNWQQQREPADARLLLEAALAAGDPDAAIPVLDWLRTTGLKSRILESLAESVQSRLETG